MNAQLVAISNVAIGGIETQTVNARELWEFVESRKDFSNWIKARIEKFGFVENQDFVIDSPNLANQTGRGGDRRSIEYFITVDMAKELAMVENNEKGRAVRRYFIECERQAKEAFSAVTLPKVPATYAEALRLAADQVEQFEAARAALEDAKPAIEFHEAVSKSDKCCTVEQFAKANGISAVKLFKIMRDLGFCFKRTPVSPNTPYQQYVDNGYFVVREKSYRDNDGDSIPYFQMMITGPGQIWLDQQVRAHFSREKELYSRLPKAA